MILKQKIQLLTIKFSSQEAVNFLPSLKREFNYQYKHLLLTSCHILLTANLNITDTSKNLRVEFREGVHLAGDVVNFRFLFVSIRSCL